VRVRRNTAHSEHPGSTIARMVMTPHSDSPPKGAPIPAASPFEVRFDALVSRLQRLAKVAGGGTIGNELADVAAEMVRVRRDMAYEVERAGDLLRQATRTVDVAGAAVLEAHEAVAAAEPPRRPYATRGTGTVRRSPNPGGRDGAKRRGTQRIHGRFVQLPEGKRWCAGHDEGAGKMLEESEFGVKNPATGALTSWCKACTRRYQQERYVRVGYKRVTIQVVEGDSCVGHDCPLCGFPMEIGEKVTGSDVAHEKCVDAKDERLRAS